jgi:hypothetical protein
LASGVSIQNDKPFIKKGDDTMKKIMGIIGLIGASAVSAFADATPLVQLPSDFTDTAKITLLVVFGAILSVLVIMFVVRKIVKTTNRS